MGQSEIESMDLIKCFDIYQELKNAQWIVQSMIDAIDIHWDDEKVIDHLSYLLSAYQEQIQEITPRLDAAFDKILPTANLKIKVQNGEQTPTMLV
jgi:hypothetical protein